MTDDVHEGRDIVFLPNDAKPCEEHALVLSEDGSIIRMLHRIPLAEDGSMRTGVVIESFEEHVEGASSPKGPLYCW